MVERLLYLVGILLILGVVCVIVAGFTPSQEIVLEWKAKLQYFLAVLGAILIELDIELNQEKKTI